MSISPADISDYVSGRLDDLESRELELAMAFDLPLRNAVARAKAVDRAVKAKLLIGHTHRSWQTH